MPLPNKPVVNSDKDTWGGTLNTYLDKLTPKTDGKYTKNSGGSVVEGVFADDVAATAAVTQNTTDIAAMPVTVVGQYTKRLEKYASLAAAIADLPNGGADGGDITVDGEISPTYAGTIPSKVTLVGRGAGKSMVVVPAGHSTPVWTINSVDRAGIVGIGGVVEADGDTGSGAYLVQIFGACTEPHLEDVKGDGFHRTVYVDGSQGTTAGTVTGLKMHRVIGNRSPLAFGIDLLNVDGADLFSCGGEHNRLDGLKLRAKAKNVRVIGGRYSHNGEGDSAGDGIDAFAGGDTFVISGVETSYNAGNGVTIKEADRVSSGTDPAIFGYVKKAQVIGLTAIGNTSQGLYTATDAGVQKAHTLEVIGGLFAENGQSGVYIGFRNATLSGVVSQQNGQHGYLVELDALRTTFTGCYAIANSQSGAGLYHGFMLQGYSGSLSNCQAVGYNEADTITSVADEQAQTKLHGLGIAFSPSATGEWRVDSLCKSVGHTFTSPANGIGFTSTSATTAVVIIDQMGSGSPMTAVGVHGSPGSMYRDLATGDLWKRTSGAPNVALTGWNKLATV